MRWFVLCLLLLCYGCGENKLFTQSPQLSVTMVSPKDGEVISSLSPLIQLQFNRPVTNINTNSITLHEGSETGPIVTLSPIISNNLTCIITPSVFLKEQTVYYVVLTSEITDFSSNPLPRTVFKFTTSTIDRPSVVILAPDKEVSQSPNIQVIFNREVRGLIGNISLHEASENGASVPLGPLINGDNYSYIFNPLSSLQPQTDYYLVLESGIKDNLGNALVRTVYEFTTGEFDNPVANAIINMNNSKEVAINSGVTVHFSKAVQNVSETTAILHEASIDGPSIPINIYGPDGANDYDFLPVAVLKPQTIYYLSLSDDIIDSSGNKLIPYTTSFTTGTFAIPRAQLIFPANGATNVTTTPTIRIQFDEPVKNVNKKSISLHQGSPSTPSISIGDITLSGENTYSFTPTQALNDQTTYYIVLESTIANSSEQLLKRTIFSFTTGIYSIPQVQILNPADKATGVSLSPKVILKFNKEVFNVEGTNKNVTLRKDSENGEIVPTTPIILGEDNTYSFSLVDKNLLQNETTYYVVLTSAIKDKSNNPLPRTVFSFTTRAPNPLWNYVGEMYIGSNANYPNLIADTNGILYLAFQDGAHSNKITVMKFNPLVDSTWQILGTAGISDGIAYEPALAMGPGNIPYITYIDGAHINKLTVKKYNPTAKAWEGVGVPGFTEVSSQIDKIAIFVASDDSIYVFYNAINTAVTPYRYRESKWEKLPFLFLNNNNVSNLAMATDSIGNIYVGARVKPSSEKYYNTGVGKFDFNTNNWLTVGNFPFSDDTMAPLYNSMTVGTSGTIYVAVKEAITGMGVYKYSPNFSSTWTSVGVKPIFGFTSYLSIAANSSEILYVAVQATNTNKTNVIQADPKVVSPQWNYVGSPNFSSGEADQQGMVVDFRDNLYVVFRNTSTNNISVMTYN